MTYRDDLDALRTRHDEIAKELGELRREQRRLEDVRAKAALLEEELAELKKTLEDKGLGAERCCINIICLVLLLGIVGVIFNMMKSD